MATRRWAVWVNGILAAACATTDTARTTDFRAAIPDTWKQAKVRKDLEACDAASGHRAYRLNVTPDGKYEFEADNRFLARPIVECMRSRGYTAYIIEKTAEGAWEIRRIGVAGE